MPAPEATPNPAWMYTTRWGIADASRLGDFEVWYEEVHLPRLLAVPGFFSATRYVLHSDQTGAHFMTTYAISGPEALESPEYVSLPGWEHWRSLVIDWHRAVFRLHEDLGDRGRDDPARSR